jgi:PKD repeat protein
VLNVGETVSLDAANSEDPDGNIVSYEWDLTGNGEVDTTGEVVSHSYSTSGEYDITLTVTDDDGDTAETTNSIVVSESNNTEDSKNKEDSGDTDNTEDEAEPTARMSISPNTPTIGQKVEFIGSASSAQNSSITSYEWDLNGDGDIDRSGEQVTYTYQNTGEFWIMLKITDENGNVGQTQEKLTVSSSGVSSDQGGNDASDTNSSTPGFGIAETLSAVGGMGYLLKRRLIDDE